MRLDPPGFDVLLGRDRKLQNENPQKRNRQADKGQYQGKDTDVGFAHRIDRRAQFGRRVSVVEGST